MNTRTKFLSLLLTLAVAAVPALKAQSADEAKQPARERGPGGGRGPNLEKLAEDLGLTADQKAKIGPILKQQAEKAQAIRKDESLSKEQRREKEKAQREETRKDLAAVLTPEQLKKFDEMRPRGGPRGEGGDRPKGEKKEKGDK